ncbi:MAG: chorismate mutase [Aldersonia sp.]|nr:chorismate mutase [Aldersonia sp.]
MTLTARPLDQTSTEADGRPLRATIDELDTEILALVRRRSELTRRAGVERLHAGLPRVTQHSEMGALRRYERELGREGVGLAIVLMRLGRTGVPSADGAA